MNVKMTKKNYDEIITKYEDRIKTLTERIERYHLWYSECNMKKEAYENFIREFTEADPDNVYDAYWSEKQWQTFFSFYT